MDNGKTLESTLKKECPRGHVWGIGTEGLPSYFVALVGGGRVGKTTYMTMVVQNLLDGQVSSGLKATFESSEDEEQQKARWRQLSKGNKLPSTQVGVPQAAVLRLRARDVGNTRLYLYDAAGEEYRKVTREADREFVFFQDLTGVILLVDPLSLPNLKSQATVEIGPQLNDFEPSATPLREVLASLRSNVTRFLRFGHSGRSDIPVAVVIGKADAPTINARVGPEAIRQAAVERGSPSSTHPDVESELCHAALLEWGADKEITTLLEHDFRRIRYFSCSPQGRVTDGSGRPFTPDRVMPPLLWLLGIEK